VFYIQFREGAAILYSEEEWFEGELQPNFRRARIDTQDEVLARWVFTKFRTACLDADPVIAWDDVPVEIEEF